MAYQYTDYDCWLRTLDALCEGVSIHDYPNLPTMEAFENEVKPAEFYCDVAYDVINGIV